MAGQGDDPRDSKVTDIDSARRAVSFKPSKMSGRIPASEFIVPTQDTKGHSARMGCRVPPGMIHEVELILQSKVFPWGTPSDFLRYAVYRTLSLCNDMMQNSKVSNLHAQVTAMLTVMREDEESAFFQDVINKAEKSVSTLLAHNARGSAKQLIKRLLDNIDRIDDKYWRERYREEMTRRFKHVMDAPDQDDSQ